MVFNTILMGSQSSCVCLRIRWQVALSKLNFTEFVDQNIKIPGKRLCSPSLEVVAWLEDA